MKRANLIDSLAGNATVQMAEALAEAAVLGIDFCLGDGIPLTQLQQIQLVKAGLMAFDGARAELLAGFDIMHRLAGMEADS